MNDFNHLKPFRFFCQKILPLVYDDALSYYEVLAKLTRNLNETNSVVNQHSESFTEIEEHFDAIEAEIAGLPEEIERMIAEALERLSGVTFRIVFGETTKAEALEAINAGKIVYFERFNKIFIHTGAAIDEGLENNHYFTHYGIIPGSQSMLIEYASIDDLFDQSTPILKSYPMRNVGTVTYGVDNYVVVDELVDKFDIVNCLYDGASYMLVETGDDYYTFGGVNSEHKFVYLTVFNETPTRWGVQEWSVPSAGIYIQETAPSDHDGLWVDTSDDSETSLDANSIGFDETENYDSNTVGDVLKQNKNNILNAGNGGEWTRVTNGISLTKTGVTIAQVDDHKIKITGTATAQRRYLFLNGQAKEAVTTTALDITLPAGTYKFNVKSTGFNTSGTLQATPNVFSGAGVVNIKDNDIITFNSNVMVGLLSLNHTNWGTDDEPSYIEVHIYEVDNKQYDLYPTFDETSRSTDILNTLKLKGCCYLAPGNYYINPVYLPENIKLAGAGRNNTKLIVTSDATDYAIRLKSNSTICDLSVEMEREGTVTPVEDYTAGTHGIQIGVETTTDTGEYNCTIENVNVINFTGCGVFIRRVGTGLNGTMIKSTKVSGCSVGFYLGVYAEYNTLIGCYARQCYTGAVIIGGNNILSGCIIGSVENGINLAAGDGYSTAHANDAHGVITGCKITHTGEYSGGAGISIIGGAQTYSELIEGCMLVGTIDIKDRGELLHFNGCSFRGQAPRFKVDNSKVVAIGCSFENPNTDRITLLNDGVFNRVACVSYSGEVITD